MNFPEFFQRIVTALLAVTINKHAKFSSYPFL